MFAIQTFETKRFYQGQYDGCLSFTSSGRKAKLYSNEKEALTALNKLDCADFCKVVMM